MKGYYTLHINCVAKYFNVYDVTECLCVNYYEDCLRFAFRYGLVSVNLTSIVRD